MDVHSLSLAGVDNTVREVFVVDVGFKAFIAESSLDLVGQLKDVDVVQVIEVLTVEASEGDHATAHETSAVSSSWFGVFLRVSADFQTLEGVALDINYEQIVEVIAKPSSKNVDFVVIDCT